MRMGMQLRGQGCMLIDIEHGTYLVHSLVLLFSSVPRNPLRPESSYEPRSGLYMAPNQMNWRLSDL